MIADNSLAWTTMVGSRPADSYITYADGSVFMDFSHEDDIVRLIRISFDGYGCCNLDRDTIIPMSLEDSSEFLKMYTSRAIEQSMMNRLITKTIAENQSLIWKDALREYELIP